MKGILNMKDKISIPLDEQETHIVYYPSEMNKECEIYTTIPSEMKRLERLVNTYPNIYILIKDDQYSYTVRCPWKLVKPRKPRSMTDEQRTAQAERLAVARANK